MTDIDTAALRAAAENPMRMQTFDGRVTEWVSINPAVVLALLDRLTSAEALLVKVPTVVTSVVRHVVGWPTPQAARTGRVVQMVMDNLQGRQIDTQERP